MGPIPGSPVNDEIIKLLGVPEPLEVLVVPVPVAGRPKAYLLADNPARAVSASVEKELVAAGQAAGDSLAAVLRGRT